MTLQEAHEKQRQEVLSLRRQVAKLQKALDQASSGLYTPDEKVKYLKQINSLTQMLKSAEKERDRYHDWWEKERDRNMHYDFGRMDLEEENARLKINSPTPLYILAEQAIKTFFALKALSASGCSSLVNWSATALGTTSVRRVVCRVFRWKLETQTMSEAKKVMALHNAL